MERQIIKQPMDCIPLLKRYEKKDVEHFGAIWLDGAHGIIKTDVLFIGGANKAYIDTKVIFWRALARKAQAFIIFHNHPSGNCTPSKEDIETTDKIKQVSELLGIQLLDHIIVTKDEYYSFLQSEIL